MPKFDAKQEVLDEIAKLRDDLKQAERQEAEYLKSSSDRRAAIQDQIDSWLALLASTPAPAPTKAAATKSTSTK